MQSVSDVQLDGHASLPVHWYAPQAVPLASAVHVPTWSARVQESQPSAQVASQQTPPAQCALSHWSAAPHATPFPCCTAHAPFKQYVSDPQSESPPHGVTPFEALEAELFPATFDATTVNVYAVPLVSPVTVAGDAPAVAV